MKTDYTVDELVKMIDEKLKDHDITFEEYLLLKEIHHFENRDDKVMQSLEEKGYVKDNVIINHPKLHEVLEALDIFFTTKKDPKKVYRDNKLLLLLTLSDLYKKNTNKINNNFLSTKVNNLN